MSSSDPKQMPALWRPPQGGSDIEHHTREWTSGTMGGGKVPSDFEWASNPRAYAEEFGANLPERALPIAIAGAVATGELPAKALPAAVAAVLPAQNSSATKT